MGAWFFVAFIKFYGAIITKFFSVVNPITKKNSVMYDCTKLHSIHCQLCDGGMRMRGIASFGIFSLFLFAYHLIGCSIFPLDTETNTILAPDWYAFLLLLLSVVSTIVFWKIFDFTKKQISYQKIIRANKKFANSKSETKISQNVETNNKNNQTVCKESKAVFTEENNGMKRVNISEILREEENWRREQQGLPIADCELKKADKMEGHDFEQWCANLLKENGFYNVEVTQGSGDQGVDILAQKDGISYAIQCKRYSSDLGNTPIQEVNAGKIIYHCHIGVVMTNRFFTPGAKEAAKATGILLWDREKLIELINNIKKD